MWYFCSRCERANQLSHYRPLFGDSSSLDLAPLTRGIFLRSREATAAPWAVEASGVSRTRNPHNEQFSSKMRRRRTRPARRRNHSLLQRPRSGSGIRFSRDERERHLYVAGKSGSGKSTVLFNLAMHDIMAADGGRDLAEAIVDAIPRERTHEVSYVDVADTQHPVGFYPTAGAGIKTTFSQSTHW
jgi:hypothetical protein